MAQLINRKEVEFITSMSRSSIYAMIKDQRFPRQVRCGKRSVRWNREEVELWMKSPFNWITSQPGKL